MNNANNSATAYQSPTKDISLKPTRKKLNFNKYKGIIIAIALFILLDASILIANFVLSFQISKDAEAVNIAGRQRMLSQRITKSLLDTKLSTDSINKEKALAELKKSSNLFDTTINAFQQSGSVQGASSNQIFIDNVKTAVSIDAVDQGLSLWKPYKQSINTLISNIENSNSNPISTEQNLDQAIEYGRKNNLELLAVMNKLTVELERIAKSKGTILRWIQTVGILLAILNFFIIMFHTLRQLKASDEKIADAQKGTEQILETVDEGLFLVDKELIISHQQSNKMEEIFAHKNIAGQSLITFLSDYISEKDSATTKDYFELLFDNRKAERLIGDLNPLREVSMQIADGNLGYKKKYLRFAFKRVKKDQEIEKILTTITDISNEIKLRDELKRAEKENTEQMNILTTVLNSNQETLASFINQSENAYSEINSILKEESRGDNRDLKEKIQHLIIIMHSIKGDASALSIGSISGIAHQFETSAQELLNKNNLEGKDFVPLIVLLEKMISYNETISSLYFKVFENNTKNPEIGSIKQEQIRDIRSTWKNLFQLSDQVSARVNKPIEFTASGLNDYSLDRNFKEYINTVAIQLIRNSINHGIESKTERYESEKPTTGRIHLNLTKLSNNNFELTFKDDGTGIQKNKLLGKALEAGIISEQQAEIMSPRKILSLLFHPGLSTSDSITQDSGRGVGMSLVLDKTNEINGKINVQTSNGIGTTFKVTIPSDSFKQDETISINTAIDNASKKIA